MKTPPRRMLVTTVAAAAMLLFAIPGSTADDGREIGAVPGSIAPGTHPDRSPETASDLDDPDAIPIGDAVEEPGAPMDQGRDPDAVPGAVTRPPDAAGPSETGDDSDDPDAATIPPLREPGLDDDDGRGL